MNLIPVGAFRCGPAAPRFDAQGMADALQQVRKTLHIVFDPAQPAPRLGLALDGEPHPAQGQRSRR